jgi:hypothetical protein
MSDFREMCENMPPRVHAECAQMAMRLARATQCPDTRASMYRIASKHASDATEKMVKQRVQGVPCRATRTGSQ